VLVHPARPALDDDAVVVQRPEDLGTGLVERAREVVLDERFDLLPPAQNPCLRRLQDDLDLGMEEVEQLRELATLDAREVEPREPLALRDRAVSPLALDAKRVARRTSG
jgi:hypothetical protein